jgi:hypothetical protein
MNVLVWFYKINNCSLLNPRVYQPKMYQEFARRNWTA